MTRPSYIHPASPDVDDHIHVNGSPAAVDDAPLPTDADAPDGGPVDIDLRVISETAQSVALEWLTEQLPERRWLLKQADPETDGITSRGWLPLGKVGILAAGGGVGKTMALTQLAVAVATGQRWYGLDVANPGRVLLALAEEDTEEVRRRLYAAARLLGLTEAERELAAERIIAVPLAGTPVALLERDERGNPRGTGILRDLHRTLKTADEWRLVILDPLTRWAGLDAETDNAQATRFVEAVETLVKAPGGPTVLLSHHTSKVSRREGEREAMAARGSSALVDGVRWVATMATDTCGDLRTVELAVAKTNYSHPGQPITLAREDDGQLRLLGRSEIVQRQESAQSERVRDIERQIIEAVNEGHYTSEEALRSAVGCGKKPLQLALAHLRASGRLIKTGRQSPFEVST